MNSLLSSAILDISRNDYHYLMRLPHVVGVGMGYKCINECMTNELSIHVLVEKKVSSDSLNCCSMIPRDYKNIKTDVIEVGSKNRESTENSENVFLGTAPTGLPQRKRPLEGGYGISVINSTNSTGTIGCVVTRGSKYYVLSNNHVLAGYNDFPIGAKFIQPGGDDKGKYPEDFVATLSDFIPLYFKSGSAVPENYVDAAIAEITNPSLKSNKIALVGAIKGVAAPVLNENIKKVGTTSGLTKGKIVTVGTTANVKYDNGKTAFFKDQVLAGLYNKGGDSGSIILNEKDEAIGLLMSGGGPNYKTCIFNNIQNVLKALKINIYLK
ncbi:hypothetical protein [Clostridium tarantellae]|uniref:Serine protease n=1 Tax=Clostridium tarantellae TaxID=39493 RepID=A0A6I1MPL7_9CLOT|nr:hypothetical protein [Clostridium tarantellae]MPQ45014.1 hypothetical protein [Clostridium tarantellae]